jgi:hypothetical protein
MGIFSSDFDPSDLSDLTGKVAIVTGGNVGIGYVTVRCLASRGAKVSLSTILKRTKDPQLTAGHFSDLFSVGLYGIKIGGKYGSRPGATRK